MIPPGRHIIQADEAQLIDFQIRARQWPLIKEGLQRLCTHYDSGRRLTDPHPFLTTVRGLLWHPRIIVRRWAYKAIGRLGDLGDLESLLARARAEEDPENQTWVMVAIVSLSGELSIREICEKARVEETRPLLLAARLFAHERWLKANPYSGLIRVDQADDLTLKWGALLAGYDRAPDNLFHPRCENRTLLGVLNEHSAPEVSEYSVWALWKNELYGPADMRIGIAEIRKQPPNVRRWINRLLTKRPEHLNPDILADLVWDCSTVAREGLAQGLRENWIPGSSDLVRSWYEREAEQHIVYLLLEHMSAFSDEDEAYRETVQQIYMVEDSTVELRRRLLAAAQGTRLHNEFRRFDVRQQAARTPGLFEDASSPTIINVGLVELNMGSTFNAGRDINAQNIAGGDVIAKTGRAIQNIAPENRAQQDVLQEILELLSSKKIDGSHATQIAEATHGVATSSTEQNKKKLIDTLRTVKDSSALAAGAAAQVDKLVDIVRSWM